MDKLLLLFQRIIVGTWEPSLIKLPFYGYLGKSSPSTFMRTKWKILWVRTNTGINEISLRDFTANEKCITSLFANEVYAIALAQTTIANHFKIYKRKYCTLFVHFFFFFLHSFQNSHFAHIPFPIFFFFLSFHEFILLAFFVALPSLFFPFLFPFFENSLFGRDFSSQEQRATHFSSRK